jgi:hypothetical protein
MFSGKVELFIVFVFFFQSVSQPIQSLLTEGLSSLGWFAAFCITAGFILMSELIQTQR